MTQWAPGDWGRFVCLFVFVFYIYIKKGFGTSLKRYGGFIRRSVTDGMTGDWRDWLTADWFRPWGPRYGQTVIQSTRGGGSARRSRCLFGRAVKRSKGGWVVRCCVFVTRKRIRRGAARGRARGLRLPATGGWVSPVSLVSTPRPVPVTDGGDKPNVDSPGSTPEVCRSIVLAAPEAFEKKNIIDAIEVRPCLFF